MKAWKYALSALGTALLIVGCGGGGGEANTNKSGYTSLVSFGDSLSDAGSYAVGAVAAQKGGRYTVNSGDLAAPTKIWLDFVAAQLGLPAPCAAETGLNSSAALGGPVPVVKNAKCTNYAQGGSRVTAPVGPANTALTPFGQGDLGQLTVPLATQVTNHLTANGGTFNGKELVTVMAGGNDAFMNGGVLGVLAATGSVATAQVFASTIGWAPADIGAIALTPAGQNAIATAAVTNMGIAGAQLAGLVKVNIIGKGATRVLVLNFPDLGSTPYALENPSAVPLVNAMVQAFNTQLSAGLSGVAGVTVADAFSVSQDQFKNPGAYGLSNVTNRACDRTPTKNPFGGASIICTPANVIAGDVSKYQFADDVHPSPYGHKLLAQFATKALAVAGWL